MPILVIYETKHGFTERCAKEFASNIGATLYRPSKNQPISIDNYDTIIIGSPIYAGQIRKELAQYLQSELPKIVNKRVGLFVCCGFEDRAMEQLERVFPQELVSIAEAKGYFGYSFEKLTFFERMLSKAVGAPLGTSKINESAITNFRELFL